MHNIINKQIKGEIWGYIEELVNLKNIVLKKKLDYGRHLGRHEECIERELVIYILMKC